MYSKNKNKKTTMESAALQENILCDKTIILSTIWKLAVVIGGLIYLVFIFSSNHHHQFCTTKHFWSSQEVKFQESNSSSTTLSHLLFGLLGSERAWHHRKAYVEAWWRPNITRGYLYLDKPPKNDLLPWSTASPPYRVSQDLTKFLEETKAVAPVMIRMVHGIMEIFKEEGHNKEFRWLVMGDDDSIFFVDNMVEVLAKYDHTKYYYLGGQSEYVLSNYWFSFNQGFGGAGFILSYPLAKALANDMDGCLRRYARFKSADLITMKCVADIGVNISPQKGIHQIDLRGDISGFLASHPKSPLLSLHHFDTVDPIFPKMDRFEATRHLMKAAKLDQSRMLQQTICYQRQKRWSISISWGYSVHIYEKTMPRSWLQKPIETFKTWSTSHPNPPHYMFNTRSLTNNDTCETPHVFFFKSITTTTTTDHQILSTYHRSNPRGLSACAVNGSHSADLVSEVLVYSPANKRTHQMDRCECCDIEYVGGTKTAIVNLRECYIDEIIA